MNTISSTNFAKIYFCNARSVCNKLPTLSAIVNSHLYDILIFTETWLNDAIPNAMLLNNNYYNLYRHDRVTKSHGGGILIYINLNYISYNLFVSNNNDMEVYSIKLNDFIFIFIYRPQSSDMVHMIRLCDLLQIIY